jgi:putative Mg2+ transporter-C (MgtC) family protein
MEAHLQEILSMVSAVLLGGIIGCERYLRDKPAGIRTNILICLGSCAFTIISTKIGGPEPTRIAAQIVTGIGFLGAGAIIQSGSNIHGLTTAAGIWTVAAIGMACGTGMYSIALTVTFLTMIVLLFLPALERKLGRHSQEDRAKGQQ